MKTLTLVLLFLLSALPARATPITWTLQDVKLEDGGTVTGDFTYDLAMGDHGLSSINITATGFDGPASMFPALSTVTFTQLDSIYQSSKEGFVSNQGSPGLLFCYNNTDPCWIHSGISVSFSEPLTNGLPVYGYLYLECVDPSTECQRLNSFPFSDEIVSGYVCTETPCPGGPPIAVPEPSSLLSILQGLAMLFILGLNSITKRFGWRFV